MTKRACKQSGIGCLVALLLTACGGGGGFTSPGAGNVRALDPAQARTYFAGSTEPGLTAEQARSQIGQRVASIQGSASPSLHLSDLSVFTTRDDLSLPERVDAACDAATCTYDLGEGVSLTIGVGDFSAGSEGLLRPVMRYRGIPLAAGAGSRTIDGAVTVESFGYGGWLEHSAFSVQGLVATSVGLRGASGYYGVSGGIASNSRPTGGSASWNGVMVATDVEGEGRESIIQGDADLSVDFGAATVDLSFSNVRDLTAGTARTGTTWSDMPVTASGVFSGTNPRGETAGRFYGPGHEEAGGTFTYDDLAGAYGLRRQ